MGYWIFGKIAFAVVYFIDEFRKWYSIALITTAATLFLCHEISLRRALVINLIVASVSAMYSSYVVSMLSLQIDTAGHQQFSIVWPNSSVKAAHHGILYTIHITLPILLIIISCCLRRGNSPSFRLLMVIMIIYISLVSPVMIAIIFDFYYASPFEMLWLLSVSSTAYKPFVCFVMDPVFKEEFVNVMLCCRKNRPVCDEHKMQHVEVNEKSVCDQANI